MIVDHSLQRSFRFSNIHASCALSPPGHGRDSNLELYVLFKHWLDTLDKADTVIDYSDYLPPVTSGYVYVCMYSVQCALHPYACSACSACSACTICK